MTELKNLAFEPSYFEDEVREGFYVSNMMKRNWAANLVVLSKIAQICDRHQITWFVNYGTLIGAIRHGGFIPWDDDVDICMLRKDYERFWNIAREELPDNYTIRNIHTEEKYTNRITCIKNHNDRVSFDPEEMREYYGCPYTASVDIFPIDGIYKDQKMEEKRRQQANCLEEAMLCVANGEEGTARGRQLLADVERQNHVTLNRKDIWSLLQKMLLMSEELFSQCDVETSDEVAVMYFWVTDGKQRFSKKLIEDIIWVPFETTYVPVPARYDALLQMEFGDYMQIYKEGGMHMYPAYQEQEDDLRKRNGQLYLRYTLQMDDLAKAPKRVSLREKTGELLDLLVQAQGQMFSLAERQQWDYVGQLLEDCQMVAIALGNMLEERLGEDAKVIRCLEQYCEEVYICSQEWNGGTQLAELLQSIAKERETALKRKKVLFLPCKAAWWKNLESIYEDTVKDEDTETVVAPIPYYIFSIDASKMEKSCDERHMFPENVPIVNIEEYDIEKERPDTIVIQAPFDGTNTSMVIPNFFYSSNLRNYTERLVYVPGLNPDPPVSLDDKAATAIRSLIEQPAVVYADRVVLESDMMRNLYLDTLTKLSDETYREYWEDKIVCISSICEKDDGRDDAVKKENECHVTDMSWWKPQYEKKKVILFYTAISFLLEYEEQAIAKLQECIRIFEDAREQILCVWDFDRNVGELENIDRELWKDLCGLKEKFEQEEIGVLDETHEIEGRLGVCSGFYGNAGFVMHQCRNLGIPVMVQNVLV